MITLVDSEGGGLGAAAVDKNAVGERQLLALVENCLQDLHQRTSETRKQWQTHKISFKIYAYV